MMDKTVQLSDGRIAAVRPLCLMHLHKAAQIHMREEEARIAEALREKHIHYGAGEMREAAENYLDASDWSFIRFCAAQKSVVYIVMISCFKPDSEGEDLALFDSESDVMAARAIDVDKLFEAVSIMSGVVTNSE